MVEFCYVETTFSFGINLPVAVPTTLRSVLFASYPSSKRLPALLPAKNPARTATGISIPSGNPGIQNLGGILPVSH